jgi:hypothetical protein
LLLFLGYINQATELHFFNLQGLMSARSLSMMLHQHTKIADCVYRKPIAWIRSRLQYRFHQTSFLLNGPVNALEDYPTRSDARRHPAR